MKTVWQTPIIAGPLDRDRMLVDSLLELHIVRRKLRFLEGEAWRAASDLRVAVDTLTDPKWREI